MPKTRFKRLGLFYLIALGCIALSIIISQFLIQSFISRQQDDSRIVNVAGRQRMLSQRISKIALQLSSPDPQNIDGKIAELAEALALWKKSHHALQRGDADLKLEGVNSDTVRLMYRKIEPHYRAMVVNAEKLLAYLTTHTSYHQDTLALYTHAIIANESSFLTGMDAIVFQYDHEAQQKVKALRRTEVLLFIISLSIIILELLFIFRPLANSVKATVQELMESEKASKKMASELSLLYEELGKSYQDLEAVNLEPESPAVFASISRDGQFSYFSPTFRKLMEYENGHPNTVQRLLSASGYKDDFIEGLLKLVSAGEKWSGEIRLITEEGDFCWIETFLVPVDLGNEIKMIARDVTEFKEAKIRSRELNRERIEKTVKEQNYRSVLILEGQEEERKRLSRELHDGVGQMLSAMKLMLESITPSNSKLMKIKLREALDLMKSIIQEVRRVSFNLTPSSLDDFGLVPAIKKFCEEINAVTNANVSFINETRFINRLEGRIETNLYRIIQEAVNNALKYAKAKNIIVKFSHTVNNLNIVIQDDGRGFDFDRVHDSGHFDKAGHGIFNMKERTAFIGGVFNLESNLGEGTRVYITLSLD